MHRVNDLVALKGSGARLPRYVGVVARVFERGYFIRYLDGTGSSIYDYEVARCTATFAGVVKHGLEDW